MIYIHLDTVQAAATVPSDLSSFLPSFFFFFFFFSSQGSVGRKTSGGLQELLGGNIDNDDEIDRRARADFGFTASPITSLRAPRDEYPPLSVRRAVEGPRGGCGWVDQTDGGFCCFSSERLERVVVGGEEGWTGECYGEI